MKKVDKHREEITEQEILERKQKFAKLDTLIHTFNRIQIEQFENIKENKACMTTCIELTVKEVNKSS